MTVISSGDLQFSIIKETTVGTVPTTGASRCEVPVSSGAAIPTFNSNDIVSNTMRPNRSSNGSRRGNGSGEGSFEIAFQRCDAVDLLMQSALSGTWTSDKLKGAKTDTAFSTVVKAASNVHFLYGGCVVNSMSIQANAAEGISSTFDFVAMNRTATANDNAISMTATGETVEWNGAEVTDITIDGTPLQYTSMTFEVTQDRTLRNVLGSYTPIGVGSSGLRGVTFTVTAYRESIAIDASITGAPQEIKFQIGGDDDGYAFTIPAAIGSVPQDVTEDDLMITMTFTAMYDETDLTNVIIERLKPPVGGG